VRLFFRRSSFLIGTGAESTLFGATEIRLVKYDETGNPAKRGWRMKRGKLRGLCLLLVAGLLPLGCLHRCLVTSEELEDNEEPSCLADGRPVRVQRLAGEIDGLERHIERFGSIVPKRADVWGQARLTAHRHEFELEMQKDLPQFNDTLQGWISRRDQVFLAGAFSLQAAVGGTKLPPPPSSGGTAVNINTATDLIGGANDPTKPGGVISRNTTISQAAAPPSFTGSTRDASGKSSPLSISLEPTIHLSQKARYLNHLHELRRINEGDDNADSPGYALNLVRIPVSIMTGSRTNRGFGAEFTVTANPHLTDDLLPNTFRNLIVRDMVDLGTVPVAHAIGALGEQNIQELSQQLDNLDNLMQQYFAADRSPQTDIGWIRRGLIAHAKEKVKEYTETPAKERIPVDVWKERNIRPAGAQKFMSPDPKILPPPISGPPLMQMKAEISPTIVKKAIEPITRPADITKQMFDIILKIESQLGITSANIPSRHRVNQLPLTPSQIGEVFDAVQIAKLVVTVNKAVKNHVVLGQPYHLDVQGALTDELQAAYEFLSIDSHRHLWDAHCSPALAHAVHARDDRMLAELYSNFFRDVSALYPPDSQDTTGGYVCDRMALKSSTVFAWALIVESSLLEERLHEDMKAVQLAKGMPCVAEGLHFHGPEPAPEARNAFNDYVRARWPIYVFALDPVTEDQNVAEDFSLRQEMQLAVALAFASGQMNASSMLRYVRRIEKDIDTISLNRTVVGFSHGDNTFGWRFYPRVQTPPLHGTGQTIVHDMLMGSKHDKETDLKERQLENGQRECVAIMVMPSFVPYVDLDCCGNWFYLTNPKFKELTLKQSMRLSQHVQTLRTVAPRCEDAAKYRDADVLMLQKRLEQLSARLPFQQQLVNVPYENTAGGFTLFNTGITDLAPELDGWYGAPGIDPTRTTALFLVGKNFSVHQTRVVVGGVELSAQPSVQIATAPGANNTIAISAASIQQNPAVELLSREVMRVTIPAGALPYMNTSLNKNLIDVHIATPYGVSRHLGVPLYVYPPAKPPLPPKNPVVTGMLGVTGIDPKKDTTLFLVGTDLDDVVAVVAGGVKLESYKDAQQTVRNRVELVNPQNLLITIPPGVQPTGNAIAIQLVTHSGKTVVTSIPLLATSEQPPASKPPVVKQWIGVDRIDPTRITTGFLVGENFQDTMRVVVGDTQLTDSKDTTGTAMRAVEVLGPGTVRITLPANPRASGNQLDLWVGTPAGASNRISLPLNVSGQPMPPVNKPVPPGNEPAPLDLLPPPTPAPKPKPAPDLSLEPPPIPRSTASATAASPELAPASEWRSSANSQATAAPQELLAPQFDNLPILEPPVEKLPFMPRLDGLDK